MAKYKVGDKVLVRKDLIVDNLYGGVDFIDDMEYLKGKICTISNVIDQDIVDIYELVEDNKYSTKYSWTEEMLEPVETENVVKNLNDLRFGDIITLRNEERYVYADTVMYGEKEQYALDCDYLKETYNEDFTTKTVRGNVCDFNEKSYDIMKIERQGKVVYERKEKIVEMTLEEVCDKLGYDVKIVENDKNEE